MDILDDMGLSKISAKNIFQKNYSFKNVGRSSFGVLFFEYYRVGKYSTYSATEPMNKRIEFV